MVKKNLNNRIEDINKYLRRKHIRHISIKDFEEVCKKYESENGLTFLPFYHDWEYATLSTSYIRNNEISIIYGLCRYNTEGLITTSEEVVIVENNKTYLRKEYTIDTKEQLEKLICETFNIRQ